MTLDEQAPTATIFGAALAGEPCLVHGFGDRPWVLPTGRWTDPADASDVALLAHCTGPTMDVGCGPGRMSEHLASSGVDVLGIDVAMEAVTQTRARGLSALHRDVFDALPAEGAWECALLADGNIGIGGDPVRLLRRVGGLLAPGGRVVADLAPPGASLSTRIVELECGGLRSRPFSWSRVGLDDVHHVAAAAGLVVRSLHDHVGRWFTVLGRADHGADHRADHGADRGAGR